MRYRFNFNEFLEISSETLLSKRPSTSKITNNSALVFNFKHILKNLLKKHVENFNRPAKMSTFGCFVFQSNI